MSDRGGKLRRSTASISDPCKIRVRVIPVGQITRRDFYKYLSLISEYSILEAEQLLKSNNPHKSRLEKLLYRSGRIHINFVTESRESRAELEEFQYFRRTLGVLGVMDCEQCEDLERCHEEFFC
ncbi:hypothetical protein DSO57_1028044 [Entomophthora muscae]|uniref:Uncharacterized protein n=1 Tax=Entomophthora muscae TaxID=34485 RepID=A0ACC2UBI1_9FUNG|nr:hypothetical protein DSO57_1028044 [Entomophthora muscae]